MVESLATSAKLPAMNRTMKNNKTGFLRFMVRRIRQLAALATLLAVVAWVVAQLDQSLYRTSFITGWTLLGLVGLLMSYNLRKKLTFLPFLGSSRAWMQIHIYFGLAAVVVFLFHIGLRIPNGKFETLLASLFLVVSVSGFYGLYITRVIPKKLTAVHQEVIFERIPSLRQQIRQQAREIAVQSATLAPAIADFYVQRLASFFEGRRSLLYYALPTGHTRRSLMREMNSLDRYLPENGRQSSEQLKDLISRKDDLDFHQAMQGRLKIWLFVHIAATYGMLVLAVFHTILVHAFHGG